MVFWVGGLHLIDLNPNSKEPSAVQLLRKVYGRDGVVTFDSHSNHFFPDQRIPYLASDLKEPVAVKTLGTTYLGPLSFYKDTGFKHTGWDYIIIHPSKEGRIVLKP